MGFGRWRMWAQAHYSDGVASSSTRNVNYSPISSFSVSLASAGFAVLHVATYSKYIKTICLQGSAMHAILGYSWTTVPWPNKEFVQRGKFSTFPARRHEPSLLQSNFMLKIVFPPLIIPRNRKNKVKKSNLCRRIWSRKSWNVIFYYFFQYHNAPSALIFY